MLQKIEKMFGGDEKITSDKLVNIIKWICEAKLLIAIMENVL